jgi:predicted acylesterase/phospholipase RssA
VIGVAFEGCACRAAFHAGVTVALLEGGTPIALCAGASSGALSAVAIAAGRGHELPDLWRRLAGRSIVSLRRLLWNRSPFDMSHLVRSTVVDELGAVDLRDRPIEALIVATRLRNLRPVVYSSHAEQALLDPLLGSCFFPILYGRPVRVRGEWLLDGGFSDNLPIEILVERGADEVIAVVASHRGTVLKSPLRPRWRPQARGAVVHVVHPRRPLEIGSWDFRLDRILRAVDEGYRCGRDFVGT